ncbi:MAG: hypothetical protein HBSAPP02_31240 [Phycisphaerae bacterium]|nr:MAG: hypothetical protein HBSAPP02_31240 [Phycisphaerae bacterium]
MHTHTHTHILFLLIAMLLSTSTRLDAGTITCPELDENPNLAFTGATGYGRYAFSYYPVNLPTYTVTSLADYDPALYYPSTETPVPSTLHGTLRYILTFEIGCLQHDPEDQGDCFNGEQPLPTGGFIEFDVTGEINLVTQLDLRGHYVKIDGSTAPYSQNYPQGGITITGNQFTVKDSSHVILRYLRFRSGVNTHGKFHCARSLAIGGEYRVTHNVIVDHCSIGASQDDNLAIYGSVCHLTVQHCIIGGGVYENCKAGIGSGGVGAFAADEGITFCHNLIAGTFMRQMLFSGPERVDFYNNVVGNAVYMTEMASGNGSQAPRINILHNWYRSSKEWPSGWGDGTTRFGDPVRAATTTDYCPAPCGNVYVPSNDEKFHLAGNRYERWDAYDQTPHWEEPYSVNNQWDLTWKVVRNGSFTTNLESSLEKESAWSMWTSDDHVSDDVRMEEHVFAAVKASAGCRLPLATPTLDMLDDEVKNSIDSGLWPWDFGPLHNLKPGLATDPEPAHSGNPDVELVVTTLKWKQTDETEFFKVYLKVGTITQDVPALVGDVAGVGQGNFAIFEIPSQFLQEGHLIPGEFYTWRIDSYNGCAYDPSVGPTTGTTWVFRAKTE